MGVHHLILLALVPMLGAQSVMPNMDILGGGYDVYQGNPLPVFIFPGAMDPGYRKPIFDMTVYSGDKTADNKWLIPFGTDVRYNVSCQTAFSGHTIAGPKSYQDSLRKHAAIDATLYPAAFGASFDFHTVEDLTSEHNGDLRMLITRASAECYVYDAALDQEPPHLDDMFRATIETAPLAYDPVFYKDILINDFGTHFVSQVVFGGNFGQVSLVTVEMWEEMLAAGISPLEAASAAAKVAFGMRDEATLESDAFDSYYTYSQSTYSQGGSYPRNGDATSWVRSITEAPGVVYFKADPLHRIVNTFFFPEISSKDLVTIANNIQRGVKEYCAQLDDQHLIYSCSAPPADPPIPS